MILHAKLQEETVRIILAAALIAVVTIFTFPQLAETKKNIYRDLEPAPVTLKQGDVVRWTAPAPISLPVPEPGPLAAPAISRPQTVVQTRVSVPASKPAAGQRLRVQATAYSSTPDQTDGDPFTTASGTRVAPHIIAANFLPMGTRVKFPELHGDAEFIVGDRMAKRFSHRVDFWKASRGEALQFGVRAVTIEVIH